MSHHIISHVTCFLAGMASGIATCIYLFVSTPHQVQNKQDLDYIPTNVVEEVCVQTNRANSTQQNVDWFKDNSNYIWDGWKIK